MLKQVCCTLTGYIIDTLMIHLSKNNHPYAQFMKNQQELADEGEDNIFFQLYVA